MLADHRGGKIESFGGSDEGARFNNLPKYLDAGQCVHAPSLRQGDVRTLVDIRRSGLDAVARTVTPAGRSVFYDLSPQQKAAELEMRAQLLIGLEHWLEKSRMTRAEAAKVPGVTQARLSDLRRGKIDRFSMDLLVRLAARAAVKPKLKLAA